MLKPYRTRVICHYNIMKRILEIVNRDPQALRQAVRDADAETVLMGSKYDPQFSMPVRVGRTDESVPITFKGFAYHRELSDVSGDVRIIYDNQTPIDIETVWYNTVKVTGTVIPPLGYIIPPQWTEVIELAVAHGLRCERLLEPLTGEFETYRFEEVTYPRKPFEGRFEPKYKTVPFVEQRTYRPGSVFVPLNQPDGKVAIFLFEPEAPDSLVSWGFFNAIFEQKEYSEHYVAEALARKMLADDPDLQTEFEQRIRKDREFAGNPRARLQFFYKRSPYWDDHKDVYPIARITTPVRVKTEPWPRNGSDWR